MGSGPSREVHHYHEDQESKERARKAHEQLEVLSRRMQEQEKICSEKERRHAEALREAEQLHAQEKAAALQQLSKLKEEQEGERKRAQVQLEEQAREARERLAQELQRERNRVHQAKRQKWLDLKRAYPVPDHLRDYINEVRETAEAEATRERFVNVGMLGDSGTGKSSQIKVLLEHAGVDLAEDQMPQISMEGDGTLVPTRFPLAALGQVSLWDLPGQGTSKIPSVTYLRNMGLKYFDAVGIVTDGRWSQGDDSLLAAVHSAGVRCFVIRSKVDLAVDAGQEDQGWNVAQTLSHVRQQLQDQTGLKPHRIHLLTSRKRFWKDFGSVDAFYEHLKKDVEASLRDEAVEEMFDQEPKDGMDGDDWIMAG